MAGTSENNVATAAASPKWVTFHDVMDDAMEGGKLFPIKRRMSISGTSTTCSSSVSSYCSSVDAAASSSPTYKKTSFDFSQSLGYREDHEIQERRKPQRSTTLASLSSDKYAAFSKLDKVQGRSKGWSGKVSCGSQGGGPMGWSDEILGLSTDDDEEAETEPKMHLNIEDNWGGGNPLHRSTWDRSPNRSFVRNFP